MAQANWRLEGEWMKNCNCAFGCPCDFNARPTNGECKAFGFANHQGPFQRHEARRTELLVTAAWPGPLHEGNGQVQPIIDERATPEQREALFGILSGQNSAEGTLFHILSVIVTKMHDPIFAPITFQFDKEARTAQLRIPGVLETEVEPIKNPVTGAPTPHPDCDAGGFRTHEGEVASANIRSTGAIKFETKGTHSTLAHVVQTPEGVVDA